MNQTKKIAIVFDDITRSETTGIYCLRGLESLGDVAYFHPNQLLGQYFSAFDIVLFIDDGLRYPIPEINCLSAYWAIDTHMDFEWALQRSRSFDLVFTAQKDGAEQLKQAGIPNVEWLPLACDPEIHGRKDVTCKYDVSFIGHSFPGEREELLNLIAEKYPNSYLGQSDYRKMADIYSASKIVFNRSLKNDINMRVFEALASGSLLITNDLSDNGQSDLFEPGKHFIIYSNAKELTEAIDYYLAHDEEREQIAATGCKEVLSHHTYQDRMQQILKAVEDYIPPEPIIIANKQSQKDSMSKTVRPLKSLSYFEFPRPEVQALVPRSAKKILDIGCGTGRLGEGLKQRQTCHVTGIELM